MSELDSFSAPWFLPTGKDKPGTVFVLLPRNWAETLVSPCFPPFLSTFCRNPLSKMSSHTSCTAWWVELNPEVCHAFLQCSVNVTVGESQVILIPSKPHVWGHWLQAKYIRIQVALYKLSLWPNIKETMTILLLEGGYNCEAELMLVSQPVWLAFHLFPHICIWVQMLEMMVLSAIEWEDRSSSGMDLRWFR